VGGLLVLHGGQGGEHFQARLPAWFWKVPHESVNQNGRWETGVVRVDFNVRGAWLQVWVVDDGRIQRYDGYFEDFRDELIKEIAAELDED
jgi:hypothetical protein